MTRLIEKMIDEIDGAEEYCEAAKEADTPEGKRIYKDLALAELGHFDKLASLYIQKMDIHTKTNNGIAFSIDLSDVWLKYFKKKAEKLRMRINEI